MALHPILDVKGIHYAPNLSILNPGVPVDELHHVWNCLAPSCTVLFDDRVQCIFLRYKWSSLNPSRGVYDFTELGLVLDDIAFYGKKASIAVQAGKTTPAWVVAEGAVQVDAVWTTGGDGTIGTPFLPHDPIIADRYQEFMIALADWIYLNGYESTLVMVKPALAVAISAEHRLIPPTGHSFPSWIDPDNDEEARGYLATRYCFAGYREDLLLEQTLKTSQVIADAFPDQYLGIPFVHGAKRYPSNGTGVFPDLTYTRNVLEEILIAHATTFGLRFFGNSTTLTGETTSSLTTLYNAITSAGGRVGFQLNAQELGYRDETRPNDPVGLQAAFDNARSLGSLYVEVHDGNMHTHQDILRTENALLRS